MLLTVILPTVSGALIAGLVGLFVQLIIESQKRRSERGRNRIQLRCYLEAVADEIRSNIEILPDLRKGAGGEQLVFTRLGGSILPSIGRIPLPEVTEALITIGGLYNFYDKVNRIWAKTIDEGGDSKKSKISIIKKNYKEKALQASKDALPRIEAILQKLM